MSKYKNSMRLYFDQEELFDKTTSTKCCYCDTKFFPFKDRAYIFDGDFFCCLHCVLCTENGESFVEKVIDESSELKRLLKR